MSKPIDDILFPVLPDQNPNPNTEQYTITEQVVLLFVKKIKII